MAEGPLMEVESEDEEQEEVTEDEMTDPEDRDVEGSQDEPGKLVTPVCT